MAVVYFLDALASLDFKFSHEISWWDISVVEMIQVIQLIQDNQLRLAHLWVDFRVISSRCTFQHRERKILAFLASLAILSQIYALFGVLLLVQILRWCINMEKNEVWLDHRSAITMNFFFVNRDLPHKTHMLYRHWSQHASEQRCRSMLMFWDAASATESPSIYCREDSSLQLT